MSWRCYFCDTYNSDDDEVCMNCDHARAESDVLNAEADAAEARAAEEAAAASARRAADRASEFDRMYSEIGDFTTSLADMCADTLSSSDDEDDDRRERPYVPASSAGRSTVASSTRYSSGRLSTRRTRRGMSVTAKKVLCSLLAVLVVAGSFALGQIILIYYFRLNNTSFTLSKFLRVCSVNVEDEGALLGWTMLIGCAATILMLYSVIRCAVKGKFRTLWLIAIPYAAASVAVPDTFMPIAAVLGIILMIFKRKVVIPAILTAVISVACIPSVLCTTFCTPEVYVVKLYSGYGQSAVVLDTIFVREGDDMPDIEVPVANNVTFIGFYDSYGVCYYDKNGKAQRKWTEADDGELFAWWSNFSVDKNVSDVIYVNDSGVLLRMPPTVEIFCLT